MKSRLITAAALVSLLALVGCSDGFPATPPDAGLGNPVFPTADELIEVVQPAMADTVGTTPTFTWVATGRRYVFLGVFIETIDIRDGAIMNTEDNIWAWHSGLGTAREGAVTWADGLNVIDGQLQEGAEPTPLTPGQGYIWAVWAWHADGVHVAASSEEMFFMVE